MMTYYHHHHTLYIPLIAPMIRHKAGMKEDKPYTYQTR